MGNEYLDKRNLFYTIELHPTKVTGGVPEIGRASCRERV